MLEREYQPINRKLEWPENYYMETDAARRRACLEEGMKDPAQAEEGSRVNLLRLLLWEKRYTDGQGKIDGTDHFLKVWVDLPFMVKEKKSFFGRKKTQENKRVIREVFQLPALMENTDCQYVWYKEFIHFCCSYIELSRRDKSYSTTLFGVSSLSEESLLKKIASDLCTKTIAYPAALGMEEEMDLLAQAAKTAFNLYYPGRMEVYEEAAKRAYDSGI